MSIDTTKVRHVARLARLSLTAEEETRFAEQLGHVLDYIERLQKVDVSNVGPLSFAGDTEAGLPLRDDQPRPGLERGEVLRQAPQQDGQAFVVPRIIE